MRLSTSKATLFSSLSLPSAAKLVKYGYEADADRLPEQPTSTHIIRRE